jgi:acetolactate synthase-1/3 small subunit
MKKAVFSVLVDNTSGVLSRVAGLFSRRGFNIDSLTVSETEDSAYSRMTIVSNGDDDVLDQIEKQLRKQVDVKEVRVLGSDNSVTRELILVKVSAGPLDRQTVISTADIFRAKIVDVSKESLTVELTGTQSKIEAFISLLGEDKVIELVRTGVTGLERGAGSLSESLSE